MGGSFKSDSTVQQAEDVPEEPGGRAPRRRLRLREGGDPLEVPAGAVEVVEHEADEAAVDAPFGVVGLQGQQAVEVEQRPGELPALDEEDRAQVERGGVPRVELEDLGIVAERGVPVAQVEPGY